MGLFDLFKKQLLDVIEWVESEPGVLAYRFPMADREIQNGAQLTVRDTQLALFINEGQIADLFEAGMHTLATQNLPLLTNLRNWDKGFQSPFKSDLYFFSTREQLDQRWGTPSPILIQDQKLGPIHIRAHGTFSYRIKNPKTFFTKLSGTKDVFRTEDLAQQLRAAILTQLGTLLGQLPVSIVEMAGNQLELSKTLKNNLLVVFSGYGLSLESFYVQSISLPEDFKDKLTPADPMQAIQKLHDMMKNGIISQSEFEAKKTELLKKVT